MPLDIYTLCHIFSYIPDNLSLRFITRLPDIPPLLPLETLTDERIDNFLYALWNYGFNTNNQYISKKVALASNKSKLLRYWVDHHMKFDIDIHRAILKDKSCNLSYILSHRPEMTFDELHSLYPKQKLFLYYGRYYMEYFDKVVSTGLLNKVTNCWEAVLYIVLTGNVVPEYVNMIIKNVGCLLYSSMKFEKIRSIETIKNAALRHPKGICIYAYVNEYTPSNYDLLLRSSKWSLTYANIKNTRIPEFEDKIVRINWFHDKYVRYYISRYSVERLFIMGGIDLWKNDKYYYAKLLKESKVDFHPEVLKYDDWIKTIIGILGKKVTQYFVPDKKLIYKIIQDGSVYDPDDASERAIKHVMKLKYATGGIMMTKIKLTNEDVIEYHRLCDEGFIEPFKDNIPEAPLVETDARSLNPYLQKYHAVNVYNMIANDLDYYVKIGVEIKHILKILSSKNMPIIDFVKKYSELVVSSISVGDLLNFDARCAYIIPDIYPADKLYIPNRCIRYYININKIVEPHPLLEYYSADILRYHRLLIKTRPLSDEILKRIYYIKPYIETMILNGVADKLSETAINKYKLCREKMVDSHDCDITSDIMPYIASESNTS